MSPTASGASNATDFQPTTRNPQGNVGGSLQPNSNSLQPLTTAGESNVFNQPGVNPQAFPKTNSLRVLSTGTKSQTSAAQPDYNPSSIGWGTLTLFFIAILATIVGIFFLVKTAKPAESKTEEKPEELPVLVTKPKKTKTKKRSKAKKKTGKKRK